MIDPKSLRIGNYYLEHGNIIQVKADSISYYANIPILLSGIPLSEQELIRLGFEETDTNRFVHSETRHQVYALKRDMFTYRVPGCSLKQVKYLHEVQNLFHAITGTELTYKVDSGLTPTEPDTNEPVIDFRRKNETE